MVWLVQSNFNSNGQTSTFWFNASSVNVLPCIHLGASLHGSIDTLMYNIVFDLEPSEKKSCNINETQSALIFLRVRVQ